MIFNFGGLKGIIEKKCEIFSVVKKITIKVSLETKVLNVLLIAFNFWL